MGCHGKMAASAEWITMDDRCYWDAMWSSADNSNRLANENTGYTQVRVYGCNICYVHLFINNRKKKSELQGTQHALVGYSASFYMYMGSQNKLPHSAVDPV